MVFSEADYWITRCTLFRNINCPGKPEVWIGISKFGKLPNYYGMALKMIDHGTKEYQQMVQMRNDILRKPLGLSFTPEELEKEKDEVLIGAFEDDKMLGCCMLVKESYNNVRLRQMAVLNNLQGKGIGRALMTFAENIARDLGYKTLTMHARKTALGFYEKQGYVKKGEEFEEVTLPHYVMEKQL